VHEPSGDLLFNPKTGEVKSGKSKAPAGFSLLDHQALTGCIGLRSFWILSALWPGRKWRIIGWLGRQESR